jgi:hypothetical protein
LPVWRSASASATPKKVTSVADVQAASLSYSAGRFVGRRVYVECRETSDGKIEKRN